MRRVLVVILALLASGLAGCADDAPRSEPPSVLEEADQAAAEVDVVATPTTGVIRGVVVDEAIRPIAGVLIEVEGMGLNQTTNDQGAFGFDGLQAGVYFLTATHLDYSSGRHSVQVEAGIDDPEPLRILVTAIPRETPFIEAIEIQLFISGAVNAPGLGAYNNGATNALGMGTWSFLNAVTPNGTVAQFEYDWEKTSDFAINGQGHATTYARPRDAREAVDDQTISGPSPIVLRLNASSPDLGTVTDVAGDLRAAPSAGTPVGAMVNQQADCFIHIFHNFVPRDDWQFGRDGEHPIPG